MNVPTGGKIMIGDLYSVPLGRFRELFERDGFGKLVWNHTGRGKSGFATMMVEDETLIADFKEASTEWAEAQKISTVRKENIQ